MVTPNELRKGNVILLQGGPHLVLDVMHRTQGRQAGFVQATLRNLDTGNSTTAKFRSTDRLEVLDVENRRLEFSYSDGDGYHFLDNETYEDVVLPLAFVEDDLRYIVPQASYDVLFVDDKPKQVQLPSTVEMKVVESPEGLRGDTASTTLKPARVETGLVVQVPLFVKQGDRIRVSTESGAYLGRA